MEVVARCPTGCAALAVAQPNATVSATATWHVDFDLLLSMRFSSYSKRNINRGVSYGLGRTTRVDVPDPELVVARSVADRR